MIRFKRKINNVCSFLPSYNINSIEYNIYKYKGISNKGDAFEDRYSNMNPKTDFLYSHFFCAK